MSTFKEALASLEAAKKQYRDSHNQSCWYKNSPEVISATLAVVEAAGSSEEAKIAYIKAPASSSAKVAAYLKLMEFCTTIKGFSGVSHRYSGQLGRTFELDFGEREPWPFEKRWEELSLEAVETAESLGKVAGLYINDYLFGEGINAASNRLQGAYANCTSFEELYAVDNEVGLYRIFGGSPIQWMHNKAHDRLYQEIYGEPFRRQSINSDVLL